LEKKGPGRIEGLSCVVVVGASICLNL